MTLTLTVVQDFNNLSLVHYVVSTIIPRKVLGRNCGAFQRPSMYQINSFKGLLSSSFQTRKAISLDMENQ